MCGIHFKHEKMNAHDTAIPHQKQYHNVAQPDRERHHTVDQTIADSQWYYEDMTCLFDYNVPATGLLSKRMKVTPVLNSPQRNE